MSIALVPMSPGPYHAKSVAHAFYSQRSAGSRSLHRGRSGAAGRAHTSARLLSYIAAFQPAFSRPRLP
ncbi:hypothetical protein FA95DRAFT_772828 [Auriscalpium vulgare]|uniref:Uncharacterized protein n=1 Tax=Auriscalpium vulgare TaxID=40419 RepID=A0ACB8RA60_9AGAM|nr:hypothetical protein FA95DRAFT_772828 [Auriscalpium vulgare]